jgi:hypothetical protein
MKLQNYKQKVLWLTILHRVVMLIAAYLYIDFIVSVTNTHGTLIGSLTLNAVNMVIYYIYNYIFLKLLRIEKGA